MANGLDSKGLRRLADKLESLQKDNKAAMAAVLADEGDTVIVELLLAEKKREFLRITKKSLEIMTRLSL